MEIKAGSKVLYCEEEYEVVKVDTDDDDSFSDLLIEDSCGYRLWVSHKDVNVIGKDVICFGL